MKGAEGPLRNYSWTLVLILGFAVRLYAAPLGYIPDESVYVQCAWNLAQGQLDLADTSWYIHRIPVYLPTAGLIAVLGVSYLTVIAWPILASLLQILLGMLLARHIYGFPADVLTGVLLALLPLDILYSAHLLPDVPFGMLTSASVVLWWIATARPDSYRVRLLLLAAGAALGLAGLIRPYAAIIVIFLGVDLVLMRTPWKMFAWFALGSIAVGIAYMAVYWLAMGDPLYRLEVVTNTYSTGTLAESARLLFYPKVLLDPRTLFGLHGWMLFGALILVYRRLEISHVRLLVWLLFVGIFLVFGSMSLTEYIPILKRARFLTILSLPICVFIGISVATGLRLKSDVSVPFSQLSIRRRAALAFCVLVLLASAAQTAHLVHRAIEQERPRFEAYSSAARSIESHPTLPVFVDHWRTAIRLAPHVSFFGGRGYYHGADDTQRQSAASALDADKLHYLSSVDGIESLPPALVLIGAAIDRHGLEPGIQLLERDDEVLLTPTNWKLLESKADLHLFLVEPR